MRLSRSIYLALLFAVSGTYLGCQSFEPIHTSTPEPAQHAEEDSVAPPTGRSVDVQLTTGTTELPGPMEELRFRIPRITLISADGSRDTRELPHAAITIGRDDNNTYSLLRTTIQPENHVRMRIEVEDVFVTYGPNAGGPLTVDEEPVEIPLPDIPDSNRPVVLGLYLDMEASIYRGYDEKWRFTPRLTAEAIEDANTAQSP